MTDLTGLTDIIRDKLEKNFDVDAFVQNAIARGEETALFRDYVDGNHRNYMSSEQAKILRIPQTQPGKRSQGLASIIQFSINYCGKIVDSMTDRLIVSGIVGVAKNGESESDNEQLNQWIQSLLMRSRFDGLQGITHDAAVGDGEVYVGIEVDTDTEEVSFVVQPSFDGRNGIIGVVDKDQNVILAIKIWQLIPNDSEEGSDENLWTRARIYLPDSIENYQAKDDDEFLPFIDEGKSTHIEEWAVGKVPFVIFQNKLKAHTTRGKSEIADVISLIDALNRALYSTVAAAELSGFGVVVSYGFDGPSEISPGMWISVSNEGNSLEASDGDRTVFQPRVEKIPAELPTAYIDTSMFLIEQISTITDTPIPQFMGSSNSSGEALKQREIGLLGKVREAQVRFGNAWEKAVLLAWDITAVYGNVPSAGNRTIVPKSIKAIWKAPELRNDAQEITLIISLFKEGVIDQKTALEELAGVIGWDNARIAQIIERATAKRGTQLSELFNIGSGI